MNTILGVFDNATDARRAIDALRASPLQLDDVSLVTKTNESGGAVANTDDVSAAQGATVGAVWGGLVGLAALLIPGVGPFIALGALGAALTGAVTGAVVGGITAALVDFSGIPEAEARGYETMVTEGKTLVAVKARDEDATEVRRILASAGADSIRDNQTDMTSSSSQRVRVAMYDEAGNRVNQELEYGAPANPTTTRTHGIYDTPAVDRGANTTLPVAEERPAMAPPSGSSAVGTGRAGQVQPRETGSGVTAIEDEEGTTTPDHPPVPRSSGRDTNLPDPDEAARRRM